jgi:hypothetical protein
MCNGCEMGQRLAGCDLARQTGVPSVSCAGSNPWRGHRSSRPPCRTLVFYRDRAAGRERTRVLQQLLGSPGFASEVRRVAPPWTARSVPVACVGASGVCRMTGIVSGYAVCGLFRRCEDHTARS